MSSFITFLSSISLNMNMHFRTAKETMRDRDAFNSAPLVSGVTKSGERERTEMVCAPSAAM